VLPSCDYPTVAEIAGRWAALYVAVLVKSSLLLAVVLVAVRFMRSASASARHMILTLGIAGMLLLPIMELILPSWGIVPIPDLKQWAKSPICGGLAAGDTSPAGPVVLLNAAPPGHHLPCPPAIPVSDPAEKAARHSQSAGTHPQMAAAWLEQSFKGSRSYRLQRGAS
jgi:hypothetical protein